MTRKKHIWSKVTSSIESDVSPSDFRTWFSRLDLKEFHPELALIEAPNKFVAHWIKENYLFNLKKAFNDHLDYIPEIRFSYGGMTAPEETVQFEETKKKKGISPYGLDPSLRFSNFITAKTNRFAYSTALHVSYDRSTDYNPLYIFSKLVSGKTHLLNAIGNQIVIKNPSLLVRYLSIDRFSRDFSLAKRFGKLLQFRNSYKKLDLLLIDDIHLLEGRKKTQKEMVTIFNLLYESKKQIVFAGKTTPAGIGQIIPELQSRLEWGVFAEIGQPNRQVKINIIKEKAKQENLQLNDDVVFFLAKVSNDLKTLMQYMIGLGTYFSLYQREIDMSTAKSIISRRTTDIDIYEIQKVTAKYFNISVSDLLSSSRSRVNSYPRQVAMYLSRDLIGLSYKEIGKMFGNRDHSTVVYAVTRIKKGIKAKKNPIFSDINKVKGFFYNNIV